jgi:glycerate kinase
LQGVTGTLIAELQRRWHLSSIFIYMHILIAPNAFKNSIDALGAAHAIKYGLIQSKLHCTTECFPIADGGDGTGTLIVDKLGGTRTTVAVQDPFGREISAYYGLIDNGRTAVIEMADASGLRLLHSNELDPLKASSYGAGQLMLHALNKGVNKIIIAMGGSATVDGGAGILSGTRLRFLNKQGESLAAIPSALQDLAKIDLSNLDKRLQNIETIVLCDVDNQLLGQEGAASVFGPQKGADDRSVEMLEEVLRRMAEAMLLQTGSNMAAVKYGGAAGGAAAGLHAAINAKLVNGIEYFLELTNFQQVLVRADLVITGEGSIDSQTLQGKGPFRCSTSCQKKKYTRHWYCW